jgi:pyruvate/2-oxoglutarate dehydrogenase complex dihydrolipoamide dehydrogenase (E3) component
LNEDEGGGANERRAIDRNNMRKLRFGIIGGGLMGREFASAAAR